MKIHRFIGTLVAVAAVGAIAIGASTAAQARDVYWSVGVASPGVQVGVSNAPPVLRVRPVVVVVPQPVYYGQPQVIYGQPQVVYGQPQVVYGQPQAVYGQPHMAYGQTQVIYGQPQVIYRSEPYYVQSAWAPPVYYQAYPGWGKRHHGQDGRWERDERRRFDGGRTDGGRNDGRHYR